MSIHVDDEVVPELPRDVYDSVMEMNFGSVTLRNITGQVVGVNGGQHFFGERFT